MKKAEIKELRAKDTQALFTELALSQKKLVELQTDLAFRKLKNIQLIKETRRKIARLWTFLNEKALAEMNKEVTK